MASFSQGHLMTTSGEHEPQATGWVGYDGLREAVAAARRERQRRGERYTEAAPFGACRAGGRAGRHSAERLTCRRG